MSEENPAEDMIYNNIRMYAVSNPPTSYSREPSFEQKCLQSLLNLRMKAKIDNSQVIICMKCWKNWYFDCQECPLCRSKEPLELILKTLSSGMSDKIHKLNYARTLVEAYERECKHPYCGNCCLNISDEVRLNCVFCYSEIFVDQEDANLPPENYCNVPTMKRCVDCLRRWMAGIKTCPFCLTDFSLGNDDLGVSNETSASMIANASASEYSNSLRDENYELENPVGTTTSINSGIFVGANSTNHNPFVIDGVSNNYGLITNENVSNMTTNETRRISGEYEAAINRHLSMLTELYTKRFTDMIDDVERSVRSKQDRDKDRSRSNSRSNNSDQDDDDDLVRSGLCTGWKKGSGNTSSRRSRKE